LLREQLEKIKLIHINMKNNNPKFVTQVVRMFPLFIIDKIICMKKINNPKILLREQLERIFSLSQLIK
jgi:hypothetical protein